MRLAVVLDEQIAPNVATALAALGYPVEHVSAVDGLGKRSPDVKVLEYCGKHGCLLMTIDRKMSSRPQERAAIKEFNVGVFFIRSGRNDVLLPPKIASLILNRWDEIVDIGRNEKHPFMKRLQPGQRIMDYETKKQRRKGPSGKKKRKKQ